MQDKLMEETVGHVNLREFHFLAGRPEFEQRRFRTGARLDQRLIGAAQAVDVAEVLIEEIAQRLLRNLGVLERDSSEH